MATELKLTEREIAIARGETPEEPENVEAVGEVEDSAGDPSEAADTEDDGSSGEAGDSEESWVTDEVRDLAATYGMSEEELEQFSDEAEFRRAGYLLDKAMKAKPPEGETKEPDGEKPPETTEEEDALIDPARFESLGYEQEILDLAKLARKSQEQAKQYRKDLAELKEFVQQARSEREAEIHERQFFDFHEAVDALGDEDLGAYLDKDGNPVELDSKFHKEREKIWKEVELVVAHAQKSGGKPPTMKAIVQRAYQLAFPDRVNQKKTKQRVDAAKRQSAMRRPVGAQAAANPPVNADPFDASVIANDPKIVAFWNRAEGRR